MSLRIETIALGKQEVDSEYWVSDVTDKKIQEIAAALGLKYYTITSGSDWVLYKGDDAYNTTGFRFKYNADSSTLEILSIVKGVTSSQINFYFKESIHVSRSKNGVGAMSAKLYYVITAKGVVLGPSPEKMQFIVDAGTDIKTGEEHTIYVHADGNAAYTDRMEAITSSYSGRLGNATCGPKDIVLLVPVVLDYTISKSLYGIKYGPQCNDYTYYDFDIDTKRYLTVNTQYNESRFAVELSTDI